MVNCLWLYLVCISIKKIDGVIKYDRLCFELFINCNFHSYFSSRSCYTT